MWLLSHQYTQSISIPEYCLLLAFTSYADNILTRNVVMAALPNIDGDLCSMPQCGWCPLLECPAVTLPRRETRWNLLGSPKLANRSQPLVGRSLPYCKDMWRRYCCLTSSFFPIVDTYLSCEDISRQSCVMVCRWRFFASRICSKPRAAHFRHAFLIRMCRSMLDIQSATAEIRRGKKDRKKQTTGQK